MPACIYQCHYVRASVLQRVGTYECVHLCVYVSVSICSYSAMYLLCVCAYHFSAFQTIHFPALEVIRRSKRTPDPQWQFFLRCFPHLLLLAIGGGLNCQNCETHSYLTHCLQSRPSFKNTLAAGGLVSLTCVYGARAPHDIQRRQKMRGAIKSSLACA